MKETCLISFGDSAEYRVPAMECSDKDMHLVEEEVKTYLKAIFPEIEALPYYSSMKLRRIPAAEAAGYPEFNATALGNIETTLKAEVKDARSVDELNLNAPFSDIN